MARPPHPTPRSTHRLKTSNLTAMKPNDEFKMENEVTTLRNEVCLLQQEKAKLIEAAMLGLECADYYRKSIWDTSAHHAAIKAVLEELHVNLDSNKITSASP